MSELVCSLDVFGDDELARYKELSRRIWAACRNRRELDDGIALYFEAGDEIEAALAEFVPLERRCCPFLTLEVVHDPEDGALELRVTGGDGVKAFLAEETAGDA